jgi:hypothetical protein
VPQPVDDVEPLLGKPGRTFAQWAQGTAARRVSAYPSRRRIRTTVTAAPRTT